MIKVGYRKERGRGAGKSEKGRSVKGERKVREGMKKDATGRTRGEGEGGRETGEIFLSVIQESVNNNMLFD